MNILDVIKNCISNPYLAKDYDIEEYTLDGNSDTRSITNQSAFSGLSSLKKTNIDNKIPSIEQSMLRLYMRVWTGIRTVLYKTVTEGNCFISMELGHFYPIRGAGGKFGYSPTLETFEKYGYTLIEDIYNIKPTNRNITISKVFLTPTILAEYSCSDKGTVRIISKELITRLVSISCKS